MHAAQIEAASCITHAARNTSSYRTNGTNMYHCAYARRTQAHFRVLNSYQGQSAYPGISTSISAAMHLVELPKCKFQKNNKILIRQQNLWHLWKQVG